MRLKTHINGMIRLKAPTITGGANVISNHNLRWTKNPIYILIFYAQ